jgi:SH3-like domain-containing protein
MLSGGLLASFSAPLLPGRVMPLSLRLFGCVIADLALPASAQSTPAHVQGSEAAPRFTAWARDRDVPRISNFSGLEVPRYSSLKSAPANGRAGPSEDYPVRWRYERAGLPVIVVRESEDWRKIRDPGGDEVWVHRRLLAAERTVITTAAGAIRRNPDAGSPEAARFGPGAVLKFEGCVGEWCRVEAETEGRKGWSMRSQLWGDEPLGPAD